MGTLTHHNLEKVMNHQPADRDQIEKYERVTGALTVAAEVILNEVPDCADKTVALRCIREAKMWANTAITLGGEI